jgi:hypothetical protein
MRRNWLLVLAAIVLLPPTTASAQGLNGALIGTVRDEQGECFPVHESKSRLPRSSAVC